MKPWPRRRLLALAVIDRLNEILSASTGVRGVPTPHELTAVRKAISDLKRDLTSVAQLPPDRTQNDLPQPTVVQAYGGPA